MSEASVQFELGTLKFSAEGSEAWVAKQLDHVISQLPQLTKITVATPAAASDAPQSSQPKPSGSVGSLASYIKDKAGDGNQVQRFLATADWLRLKGETNLNTGAVSKALKQNHQSKLSNPADTLNKNVAKGFCEKTADGFFITPEGLKALGHTD